MRIIYLSRYNSSEPIREDFDLLEQSVPTGLAIAFLVDRNADDRRPLAAAAVEVAAIANQDERHSFGLCCAQVYAFRYGRDPAFHASLSTVMAALACWLDRRECILRNTKLMLFPLNEFLAMSGSGGNCDCWCKTAVLTPTDPATPVFEC